METTKTERMDWLGATKLIHDMPIVARLCRDIEELLATPQTKIDQATIAEAQECRAKTDENRRLKATIDNRDEEIVRLQCELVEKSARINALEQVITDKAPSPEYVTRAELIAACQSIVENYDGPVRSGFDSLAGYLETR